jgi:1,4-alpha-glucan branching enzyme
VRRACFISWQYFEDVFYAGIGRAVAMAAQALAAEGVEVHVITVAPTAERVDERLGDVHIHRVPDRTAHGDPLHLRALGWAAATAERYAELDAEVGFDLVEVPDYHAEGLSLELRPGTALVATLHGTIAVFGDANQADAPTIDLQAFCGLELAALRRADLLLAPTALLLERTRAVATLDADDATVPHAFDVSGFPAREAPASLPEVLTVTFAGRIERRKGPDLAVRAVAAAARRGRRIHLRLVGGAYDGFLDDVVLPLAAELGVEDLSVEPPVGTDELMSIVRSSDCMVLPSRLDNFHFAAVEALASGVPVITTDHNGLTQWFGPEDGLAAPPLADPEVFAERAADRLLDDAWLLASGPRAAAAVRERLDPHRIGERLLDVYETTVARVQARGAATAAADTAREARALDRRRAQAAGGLDTRRRVTLVSEREIHERPDLLGAYAAVTCGDDDASLLIVSHEAPDVVAPRILDLLRDLGLDADGAPDMVLSPEVRDGGAALAPMLTAVLSEQPLPPELAAVPCVGADGAGRIAGLILPTTGSAA